ncbi:MAG: hypothetical protein JHD33_01865 [Chthoniobacterales bacterium]|nr:hypothetical protein [Chthoniobacterales bacterium]
MKSRGSLLFAVAAWTVCATGLFAATVPAENPQRPSGHTLSRWLEDRMVRPVDPFELVPGKDPDGWGLVIEPYGWSPGVYGRIGIKKLADRIGEKLPTHVEASRWWIDPIVGLRGQVNFTRWLFAAAQADAGGFGVGSQITWNTQATLGVNVSRNITL